MRLGEEIGLGASVSTAERPSLECFEGKGCMGGRKAEGRRGRTSERDEELTAFLVGPFSNRASEDGCSQGGC